MLIGQSIIDGQVCWLVIDWDVGHSVNPYR